MKMARTWPMTKISWSEMIETTLVVALLSAISNQGKAASESTDTARGQTNEYDVVVIGGTPAGIAAAIAAGRAGKTVIVIEQTPVLGGVLSSGVIRLDDLYVESNSGVMEEFRQRVRTYHRTKLADDPLVKAHKKLDPRFPWNVAEGRAWEPHTAARIYAELVAEVKAITTRFNEVAVNVKMKEMRITGVITRNRDNQGRLGKKRLHTGQVIIDATYGADQRSQAFTYDLGWLYYIQTEGGSPDGCASTPKYASSRRIFVSGRPTVVLAPHQERDSILSPCL
jgi:hypothetical protein